jgi:hypothetical protein
VNPVILFAEPAPPAPAALVGEGVAVADPTAPAPPPPPAFAEYVTILMLNFHLSLPCDGLDGGVFPAAPVLDKLIPAPPPEPPDPPKPAAVPPAPPPADVIVENTESVPDPAAEVLVLLSLLHLLLL